MMTREEDRKDEDGNRDDGLDYDEHGGAGGQDSGVKQQQKWKKIMPRRGCVPSLCCVPVAVPPMLLTLRGWQILTL